MAEQSKDISIIIPVYNAIDVLPRCIDSILIQDFDHKRMEVILVDDGSTDGSSKLCDNYAAEHPGMIYAIHQENSGGPASPRNQGIRTAVVEYLFFCDNDDYFGDEAIRRVLQHAVDWNSDVLLAKLGDTGRPISRSALFKETLPKADLYTSRVIQTLGPWKLYRREMLIENSIYFPEDCSLDDSVFTLKAYFYAKIISVASDYDYYFWTKSEGGTSLSESGGSDKSTWRSIPKRLLAAERMLKMIDEFAEKGREIECYLKVIGHPTYNTLRLIADETNEEADSNLTSARKILTPYCSEDLLMRMTFNKRIVYLCLVEGNEHDCFRTTKKQASKGVLRYREKDSLYQCSYSIKQSLGCAGCNKAVNSEIQRVEKNRDKESLELSEREKEEVKWLEKIRTKQKINKHLAGRLLLKFISIPTVNKLFRPVIRRYFK